MLGLIDTDRLFAYENGLLDEWIDVIDLFQELIDTGLVDHLQGHYGRTAARLIESGECHLAGIVPADEEVYAMHGIDDGPDPDKLHPSTLPEIEVEPMETILNESGLSTGHTSPLRKAIESQHVGAIWGQEPE